MGAKLTKKGTGLDKILKHLAKSAKDAQVVVGILGKNAPRGDGELDNVALGLIHEFGLGVPERSFLRRTFDRRKEQWTKLARRLIKLVAADKLEIGQALRLLGERMKADVKGTITAGAGIPPPLAPATVRAKGSARPLVDTGRLVGSIDYDVRLKGGG
jgi:hypothetical protein